MRGLPPSQAVVIAPNQSSAGGPLMIQPQAPWSAPRNRTLEDVAVRFLNDNAGKIYLGLSVLTLMVVAVKEQWFIAL
jgi:hypothetical protein